MDKNIGSKLGINPSKGKTKKNFFSSYRILLNEQTKTQKPRPSPLPRTKSSVQESLPISSNINQVKKDQSSFKLLQISTFPPNINMQSRPAILGHAIAIETLIPLYV